MKNETPVEKPGIVRRFVRLFTDNWGLKLVAFALAVLLYYSFKPVNNTDNGDRRRRPRDRDPETTVVQKVLREVTAPTPQPTEKK